MLRMCLWNIAPVKQSYLKKRINILLYFVILLKSGHLYVSAIHDNNDDNDDNGSSKCQLFSLFLQSNKGFT